MMRWIGPFAAGMLFAVGLVVSGMTQPGKVLAFLDFAGAWDPSLALVMVGAIGTHALLLRLVLRRGRPVLAERFALPTRKDIDGRLIGGAVIFGIGWGLAGYCPGPAVVALGTGGQPAFVFVAAMVVGMLAFRIVNPRAAAVTVE